MHMSPPSHVATTKGESNVERETRKEDQSSKKAAAEHEQLSQRKREAVEALARSVVLTKSTTPKSKAKAKGVVIQKGVSKSKEAVQETSK